MKKITITENALHDMARRQQAFLSAKDVRKDKKPVGFLFCLQAVSQALFGMPYEQAKATLLSKTDEEAVTTTAHPVWLLHYGSETVLTLHGNYVCCCAPGTDMETPLHALKAQAAALAQQYGAEVQECSLPDILPEYWEMDALLKLAEDLNLFSHTQPLWCLLNESGHRFFFDGSHCPAGIDGSIEVDEDDYMDTIFWMVECTDGFEDYLSFTDLKNAKPIHGNGAGSHWVYSRDFGDVVLEVR